MLGPASAALESAAATAGNAGSSLGRDPRRSDPGLRAHDPHGRLVREPRVARLVRGPRGAAVRGDLRPVRRCRHQSRTLSVDLAEAATAMDTNVTDSADVAADLSVLAAQLGELEASLGGGGHEGEGPGAGGRQHRPPGRRGPVRARRAAPLAGRPGGRLGLAWLALVSRRVRGLSPPSLSRRFSRLMANRDCSLWGRFSSNGSRSTRPHVRRRPPSVGTVPAIRTLSPDLAIGSPTSSTRLVPTIDGRARRPNDVSQDVQPLEGFRVPCRNPPTATRR